MRAFHSVRRHGSRRKGFALLLVVGCLLIVTVAAVSASRHSLGLSLEAVALEDQVQRRWELATLERVGLTSAVAAYGGPLVAWDVASSEQELAIQRRAPQREYRISLNGRTYHVLIADESAKANLNTAAALKPQGLTELTRTLSRGRLQLSAAAKDTERPAAGPTPNLFDWRDFRRRRTSPSDDVRLDELAATASNLTTWGDGRINLLSATDPVLFEMSRLIVSDGDSRDWIAEYRQSFPQRGPLEIFVELGFDQRRLDALADMLSTQSTCVSVWIVGEQQSSLCLATRRGAGPWRSAVVQRSDTPRTLNTP